MAPDTTSGGVLLDPKVIAGSIDAPADATPEQRASAAELQELLFGGIDVGRGLCDASVDKTDPRRIADVREAWYRLGHLPELEPEVAALVAAGIFPMAGGMPTGSGSLAFQHNLPAPGTFVEDSDQFFRSTERNDMPIRPVAFPGLGGAAVDIPVPQVGVWGGLRLVFKGSLVVSGGGTVTALYQWPWNGPAKRIALNVNGQTGILAAEGLDYRARRQRVYRNPREEVSSAPATDTNTGNPNPGVITNGTYTVTLVYDVPVTHDDYNLIGALYAQSDANQFFVRVEPGASTDVFTLAGGSTAVLTGTYYPMMTMYDIPSGDTQNGRQILLPNLSWLHGLLAYNTQFANTGDVPDALIRTAGQLLATYVYIDNGGAAQIDPLALDEFRWEYGGNRRSRVFRPVEQLVEKNVHDYNGRLRPGYLLLDNEVDNPVRDLVYPKGVTALQVVPVVAVGTTINANAHIHTVEETMYPGR